MDEQMRKEILGKIQIAPKSQDEIKLLDEVIHAFTGGVQFEQLKNDSEPFGNHPNIKESLDKVLAFIESPEGQKFLKT